MHIIVNRSMAFRNPKKEGSYFIASTGGKVFDNHTAKLSGTQMGAPEWIRSTPEWKLAIADGSIVEIAVKSPAVAAAPAPKKTETPAAELGIKDEEKKSKSAS